MNMENMMDEYSTNNKNKTDLNCYENDSTYSLIYDLTNEINYYKSQKEYLTRVMQKLLQQNVNLWNKMCFLNDRINFINITHSNTTNFIIFNAYLIKNLILNDMNIYDKNVEKIQMMKVHYERATETICYCNNILMKLQ
jgi:hypothetical protein